MRAVLLRLLRVADLLLVPFTALAALWLRTVRRVGMHRMPAARATCRAIGVFPIRDHYYEPLFQPGQLRGSLRTVRALPGIDLNLDEQLALLDRFRWQDELLAFPYAPPREPGYHYDNPSFGPGDAEYLYSLLRLVRPRRLVEVGSGNSTRIAHAALARNRAEDPAYRCDHVCIEPYEAPWLERLGVRVIRERVERLGVEPFVGLGAGDVLFIDSSHVIRPQGDVVFTYLEVLPRLAPGVLVHVHDVYTPRDVPDEWVHERVRFWNEQYLLEGFLSCNPTFRVVGAVNHLKHDHFDRLAARLPVLGRHPAHEPGSFWIARSGAPLDFAAASDG